MNESLPAAQDSCKWRASMNNVMNQWPTNGYGTSPDLMKDHEFWLCNFWHVFYLGMVSQEALDYKILIQD